jgi:hypothetical protein
VVSKEPDVSDDEVMILMFSLIVAGVGYLRWLWPIPAMSPMLCGWTYRSAVVVLPLLCAVLLLAVLRYLAADDVRTDARYLAMYEVLGGAWVLMAAMLLPCLGYSVRDDVLERRNGAALWAIGGALVGLTLCFAGGNIGNGPGWWVVVFAAALSTFAFFALWVLFEWLARPSEAITIGRDVAAGLRLAGLLVAAGLILGRAVAGDWVSAQATLRDLALRGWPAVVLFAAGIVVERIAPPQTGRGIGAAASMGLLPALIYLAGAGTWLSISGIGN